MDSARRLGDERALAAALSAHHVVLSAPEHTADRLRCATEVLDLARRASDRELALQARNWRVADFFELGDGDATKAELDAYAALAAQTPLPVYSWYVPMWRATIAVLAGRLGDGAELARRARDLGRRAGDANADVFWREHRHMRWLADERYDEWTEQEIAYVDQKAERSPAGRAFSAGLAMIYAALDRRDDAGLALDTVAIDGFAAVPGDMNWLSTMASAAETCALLGDVERAETLRTLLEPRADRLVVAARAFFHFGSVAYFLARLAATLGDDQAADALYAGATRRDEPVQRSGSCATCATTASSCSNAATAGKPTSCSTEPRMAPGLPASSACWKRSPRRTTGYAPTGVQLPARGPDIAATERSTPSRAKRKQDPVGPSVFRTGTGR